MVNSGTTPVEIINYDQRKMHVALPAKNLRSEFKENILYIHFDIIG